MRRHPAYLFLDCETTGVEDDDQIWQLAWILEHADGEEIARSENLIAHSRNPNPWVLLNTPYVERLTHPDANLVQLRLAIDTIRVAARAAGYENKGDVFLVGAVPSFDDFKIRRWTKPQWNYHLICIETLIMGAFGLETPPGLKTLAELTGVENRRPHDAMSDAQHVRDLMHWLRKKNAA